MKLTLVRHGETEENIHHIIQGQNPGHLSENGRKEVQELALKLSTRKFDAIYSSDLLRCVDTAKPIHEYMKSTPLIYSKEIRELSFGRFEGFPAFFTKIGIKLGAIFNLKAPGGENWTDLSNRVIPFLNSIYEKYPDGNVLLVTHGGPIRFIIPLLDKSIKSKTFDQAVPNCSIWELNLNAKII